MVGSPYREHILDHYQNPRHRGDLEAPDRVGEAHNAVCGDRVRMTLRVDEAGRVDEAAFSGDGCVIALASASILAEHAHGQGVTDLQGLSENDVMSLLRVDLGPARRQCARVALEALQDALAP